MAVFLVKAMDREGREVKVRVDGSSAQDVITQFRDHTLVPIQIISDPSPQQIKDTPLLNEDLSDHQSPKEPTVEKEQEPLTEAKTKVDEDSPKASAQGIGKCGLIILIIGAILIAVFILSFWL